MEAGSIVFVGSRLLRWGLAEIVCGLGNILPAAAGPGFWRLALGLNPHHEVAASNRARALLDRGHAEAWPAFEALLRQLANPANTSASDLHLSRTPGRVVRRLAARWLWGPSAADVESQHDRSLRQTCESLARDFTARWIRGGELEAAARALETWQSVAGDRLEIRWARAEIAWRRAGGEASGLDECIPLASAGRFVSPTDPWLWGERGLEAGRLELASRCLELARRWLPEEATTWRLDARLAHTLGELERAATSRERVLFFDPQDIPTFLCHLAPEHRWQRASGRLTISAPDSIRLGRRAEVRIRLEAPSAAGWALHLLPPAGHGLRAPRAQQKPGTAGAWSVEIEACRGDRVRGGPWPLVALAVDTDGRYLETRAEISVVDEAPGRVLLVVTEDHEIQEERGHLTAPALQELLVEKSRFAADLGRPWTHMVEVGSTLAMTDWARDHGDASWVRLRREVRQHLAEEVRRGHDLQPHLHTFNDPAYPHFPYRTGDGGWQPDLRFLLTGAELRGDWASVCPPPRGDEVAEPESTPRALDRLESVARAVSQLEEVGRLGSPDFRPVLWRSGLLEYGDHPADRAWSGVALRRAGLLADSDRNKPGSPRAGAVPPAFFASREEPFEPRPGGPLLQLPIVANLEGDYLMGPRALERRARKCVEAVRRNREPVPGVHLFTVLTHDKFINARRGREELRLDKDYGDWRTLREHLDAWQRLGVEQVTAAEGVEAVAHDLGWSPVARLDQETFVMSRHEIRYRLRVLGAGIPVDPEHPQHLWVPVPCSLRRRVRAVAVSDDDHEAREVELEPCRSAFWWLRSRDTPAFVVFTLDRPMGPRLASLEDSGAGGWRLRLEAEEPFLDARIRLPWSLGLPEGRRFRAFDRSDGSALETRSLADSLLLTGLRFPDHEAEPRLDLELQLEEEQPLRAETAAKREVNG